MVMQNDATTLKTNWEDYYKVNCILPYNPAISLLGICPRETKVYVYIKTYSEWLQQLYS